MKSAYEIFSLYNRTRNEQVPVEVIFANLQSNYNYTREQCNKIIKNIRYIGMDKIMSSIKEQYNIGLIEEIINILSDLNLTEKEKSDIINLLIIES